MPLKYFKVLLCCCMLFSCSISMAQVKNPGLSVTGEFASNSFPLISINTIPAFYYDTIDAKVVQVVAVAFLKDLLLVSDRQLPLKTGKVITDDYAVIAGTIGHSSLIDELIANRKISVDQVKGGWEQFSITVVNSPHQKTKKLLVIAGSDPRGTAFGIFHLSRLMGVSPFVWWADAVPQQKKQLFISGSYVSQEPSVKYRGVFLNDEDWGLQPWAAKTFEPETGDIGPKTYAKIFELLLRLRANLIWPAMHPSTKAFFHYPGNAQMAADYSIVIGSSHAEPMLRNNVDEWKEKTMGEFNFITNHDTIYKYWEDRVIQSKGFNAFYTLGIRGVHDSKMLGANTLQEQKEVMDKAVKEQRGMLVKHINPAIEKVPQAFIPYKEVQDIYDYGFEVPQDVTLVWCDDNYGYIRHFPNEKESAQKGGNGVYYHISYWGRPHDYLWLASSHPAQIYTQMRLAYDKGAKEMWIVNVGDIKPEEYLTELFLDMAWSIDSIANNQKGLEQHLSGWLAREFGTSNAKEIVPVMNEYYRLAYIRKPEFMGATRTEETDPKYKLVADLPWSEPEMRQRLKEYAVIDAKVVQLAKRISSPKKDSWFQLIEYPVRGAAAINKKLLYAQLARHGKAGWKLSDAAYDTIVQLTNRYNSLGNGKWKYMMDFKPRKLAVYDRAIKKPADKPLAQPVNPLFVINGTDYRTYTGQKPLAHGLGYQRGAVSLPKGSSVSFPFTANNDSLRIVLVLAPNHPAEGTKIRYTIQVDDGPAQTIDYATQGRSEEWKQNVLTNQAIRVTNHIVAKPGKHTVKITAVDDGVVVDQVKLFSK